MRRQKERHLSGNASRAYHYDVTTGVIEQIEGSNEVLVTSLLPMVHH